MVAEFIRALGNNMRHDDISDTHVEIDDPVTMTSFIHETRRDMKDVKGMVSKINTCLMGDMVDQKTQGLVVDIREMKAFKREYDEVKALEIIKATDKKFQTITRFFYWILGIAGLGVVSYVTGFLRALGKLIHQ
jgi:hypothetical protein